MRLPFLVLPVLAVVLVAALVAGGCGDDEPATSAPRAAVPAAGSYEYATSGSERIGGPLPGVHRYGPRSTVAVDVSGCELTERWDASAERWAEWRYCITGD